MTHRPVILGNPVAVAELTLYCHADHEVTVLTDGHRVVAHSAGMLFTGTAYRDHTTFVIYCERPDRHGEPCGHRLVADTTDHDAWRAATDADHRTLTDRMPVQW